MDANVYRFSPLGFKLQHIRMEFCEKAQKFKSSIKAGLHIKAHSKSVLQVIFKSPAPWVLPAAHSYFLWRGKEKKRTLVPGFVALTAPE